MLSLIISPCCEEFSNTDLVDSTEDLQARLMDFNFLPADDREGMIIMSMDATALFSSIQIERSCEAVREIIEESSVKLLGINVEELSRYLAVVLSAEEIKEHNLGELVMVRKKRGQDIPTF